MENQPRSKIFNLKSNLTCNIHVDIGLGEKPFNTNSYCTSLYWEEEHAKTKAENWLGLSVFCEEQHVTNITYSCKDKEFKSREIHWLSLFTNSTQSCSHMANKMRSYNSIIWLYSKNWLVSITWAHFCNKREFFFERKRVYSSDFNRPLFLVLYQWNCVFMPNLHSLFWCPKGKQTLKSSNKWNCVIDTHVL